MNEPSEAIAQGASGSRKWLMLLTEVPSKPDYLRVKLRRRVQRLGAVGLKGAVYLLPDNPDAAEAFQWLRREILADGGEATLCEAELIDGMTDGSVIELFNADRDSEYREFVSACADLTARWSGGGAAGELADSGFAAERERLRRRLEEILGRDYFSAPKREDAMQAIERLIVLDINVTRRDASGAERYRGRIWSTRAGVKVDRISSAWLIRREIDPDAAVVFVPAGKPVPAGSVQFDMFDGEFTHDGNRCTFEVLLDRFTIADPALRAIGQMVHDIDLHEDTFARPETAGFAAMINGIVSAFAGDEDRLREGGKVLDLFAAGFAIRAAPAP